MSAKWMRIESNFVNHFKVQRLATQLSSSKAEAGWLIMRALSWFSQFCPTGQVPGQHRDSDARALEAFAEWTGEPGRMLAAFIAVGLIDDTEDGGFGYHDWAEHQGKVSANAEKERKRKADYRARKAAEKAAREAELSRGTPHGTKAGRPALRDVTGRDGTGRSSSYDDEGGSPSSAYEGEGVAFFDWLQAQRLQLGWPAEETPHLAELGEFFVAAMRKLNDDEAGTRAALEVAWGLPGEPGGYSRDKHWIKSSLPWNGFVAQWSRHVRKSRHPGDETLVVDRTESQEFAEGAHA